MRGLVTKTQYRKSKPKASYGFIAGIDGETYWFHLKDESIKPNDEVEFKGAENEKGFYAYDVAKIYQ